MCGVRINCGRCARSRGVRCGAWRCGDEEGAEGAGAGSPNGPAQTSFKGVRCWARPPYLALPCAFRPHTRGDEQELLSPTRLAIPTPHPPHPTHPSQPQMTRLLLLSTLALLSIRPVVSGDLVGMNICADGGSGGCSSLCTSWTTAAGSCSVCDSKNGACSPYNPSSITTLSGKDGSITFYGDSTCSSASSGAYTFPGECCGVGGAFRTAPHLSARTRHAATCTEQCACAKICTRAMRLWMRARVNSWGTASESFVCARREGSLGAVEAPAREVFAVGGCHPPLLHALGRCFTS